jgi:hypothetical protein
VLGLDDRAALRIRVHIVRVAVWDLQTEIVQVVQCTPHSGGCGVESIPCPLAVLNNLNEILSNIFWRKERQDSESHKVHDKLDR